MICNKLKYLAFGASYWCRRYILQQKMPFIAGLVLNQSCNMHCEGCHVSRIDKIYDPVRSDVELAILKLKEMGVRNLAITGGEPFLWESNGWNVSDVIRFARNNGFLAVTVYTNGTLPFDDCNADEQLCYQQSFQQIMSVLLGVPDLDQRIHQSLDAC